tara:strand:+ start:817 stop:1266 length:450 start_codon:yes stop_codon:yes gene_type:complete
MDKGIEYLEFPNVTLKQFPPNPNNLFSKNSCAVAVNYWIYDKKRKTVVKTGSSRACGENYNKSSIHAEQIAIEYCRLARNPNLHIIIWRWSRRGQIKPTYCCHSCSQLVKKYNYQHRIFTFNENVKENALIENPSLSLAYKIKYGLTDY